MDDLHETRVDGVACFWVETKRPTLASMLMFRYGMADEPLVESGWQHLLEHLALDGRGGGAVSVNGQVSMLETVFQVHGPASGVAALLGEVCEWLSDPELSRLEHEAKVLRSEASMRGTSAAASAMSMRYGAGGPGLAGYRDPGLGRATVQGLRGRASRVFTRENAVLVLDGPPPETLRLPLAGGELLACQPAVPCDDMLPAAYLSEGGLTVSGVVERSSEMFLAHELLREAMARRFRTRDGSAYAPWVSYERVDADHAVVIGGSDIRPDAVGPVADQTLLVVRRLSTRLADPVPFEQIKAARIQSVTDPYARMGIAVRAGHEALQGRPPLTLEEMVHEIESADLVRIQEQWAAFHSSMLLGVPRGATWSDQLPVLQFPTTIARRSGKRYRSVNWPADRSRLNISDEGVEISAEGNARRALWDRVVGVLTFEDGLRHVMRRDGYGLSVDPHAWRSGAKAIAHLDALVPAELRLPHPPLSRGAKAPNRMSFA